MSRSRRKISLKKVLCLVLVVIVSILAVGGITSFAKKDTEKVSGIVFTRGGIEEKNGEHSRREDAIYTEDLIACKGLKVTPDFDSHVEYQVFWYNANKEYCSCTELTNEIFTGAVPDYAKYCRIMIVPNNEDSATEDTKVQFWETLGIASSVKIEVSKNQTYTPIDYYELALLKTAPKDHVVTSIDEEYEFYEYKYFYGSGITNFVDGMTPNDLNHSVIKLNCNDVSEYRFEFNENDTGKNNVIVAFFDESGGLLSIYTYAHTDEPSDVIVPEGAAYVCFNVVVDAKPIVINVLKPRISE